MRMDVPRGSLRRPMSEVSDLAPGISRTGQPAWMSPGVLEVPLSGTPTPAQATLIRRRMVTRDPAEEQLVTTLAAARTVMAAVPLSLITAEGRAIRAVTDLLLKTYGE